MWCLVNAKARIAIFFYGEDGGRSRNVLKDFLSDAKELKSIQSDGYNAYMYLDDELVDIEHLCCLAHARAKFWYAYEQGCDLARFSTCRQVGVSFRDYFRKLMKELGTGGTDYENLLPMTIGLKKNSEKSLNLTAKIFYDPVLRAVKRVYPLFWTDTSITDVLREKIG